MGEPVRIVELARNMIHLAGYEPDVDIAIEFTGPRPGEQLHEELFATGERAEPTSAPRIRRAVRREPLTAIEVEDMLARVGEMIGSGDETGLAEQLIEIVGGTPKPEPLDPSLRNV